MDDCLFCKIIKKEIPAKIVYESDQILAFPDISPSADVHILIVPKEHIATVSDLVAKPPSVEDHGKLLVEVYSVAKKLVAENNLGNNLYRVVVNGGKAQKVPHLHFHFLGGNWKKMV